MLLEEINKPNDIKKIHPKDYSKLALEIRRFLVHKVSDTGGHLASNLGTVELTMAIHLALDLPKDKVIWDVGHQSYTHKLLTGRKDEFDSLRQYNGLSGFPKMNENECDAFGTGHSSTSISVGLGMVMGQKLNRKESTIISVIGDGALTGGLAFEALNNAASINRNFIIILNDNNMSISENVGSMSGYLDNLRLGEGYNDLKAGVQKTLHRVPVIGDSLVDKISKTKSSIKQLLVPGMFFEDMGITYVGPVDGHDVKKMVNLINEAKKIDHPVLIHVLTKKGKGYKYAEHFPAKFHGIDPFYVKTGELKNKKNYKTYTNVFSKTICKLANEDKKIVAITAAMEDGCGLADFKKMYPDRFVDVGIAEEHAVTFAGGLSTCGFKPYFAVYSSFLQRGYDEIIHDICIQNLPVKFMVDRAGIVGSDGETHQGIFDISYLLSMPNMTVISPSTSKELERAILFANEYDKPIAVRYPRGEVFDLSEDLDDRDLYEYGKSRIVSEGRDVCIIAVGSSLKEALVAKKILNDKGINPKVVDARFIKPFDRTLIDETINDIKLYVTIEEGVINGGFGREVMGLLNDDYYDKSCRCINIGIKDTFVEQGAPDILKKIYGLDGNYISKTIIDALNMENI